MTIKILNVLNELIGKKQLINFVFFIKSFKIVK